MSETLNEWYPQSISPSSSSSSFGYSSMASNHTNSSSSTQITTSPTSKPIKRRSRSSKRTPTTLLNANTTNFRALVQQFTGCHRTKSTTSCSNSLLIGCPKGPVNLNFQLGSVGVQNTDQSFNLGDFSDHNYGDQIQTQIYNQLQPQEQQAAEQDYVNVLSREDVNNFETRSSELGFEDLEPMMMSDGVDLADEIASLQQPLSDQNFDHGFYWNLHTQFPFFSHTN